MVPYAPQRLLRDALEAARAITDDRSPRPALERVAEAALERGDAALAGEVLLALDEPAARAWLHGELARRQLRALPPEALRRHLDAALACLEEPGRWRPRGPGWMGPDDAQASLSILAARMGELDRAEQLASALPLGRPARARAWAALTEARFSMEEGDAVGAWRRAREAATSLAEPTESLRARVELATVTARCGDAVRAASLANVRDGDPLHDPLSRALLGEQIGLVLAEIGRADAAARTWHRALGNLLLDDDLPVPAAEVVCRIARLQLQWVGPDTATDVLARATQMARAQPLSPDPDLHYAWRLLYETSLAEPALAGPLRDWLRIQPRVPPGWCFVLGLLEQSTGHVQRARWAADALDRGHAANPSDGESGWLAALLWLRTGQAGEGLTSAQRVLEAVGAGRTIVVPGTGGAPQPLERVLADALLRAGLRGAAVALGRTLDAATLRGQVLTAGAEAAHAEGASDEALALCLEAVQAFSTIGDAASASSWLPDAARLVRLLDQLGAPDAGQRLLAAAIAAAGDAAGDLALTLLCGLAAELAPLGGAWADPPRAAAAERVAAVDDPARRCDLLLSWLEFEEPALTDG